MQTREEWLRWRKQGLGSSDYAVIMGVSPWKTIYELYEEKISDSVNETTSWVMQQGNIMEPRIRSLYELEVGKSFTPKNYVMAESEHMRVSLDGIDDPGVELVEIKYCRQADWELAKQGIVPDKYWPQVQGQLMVSGGKKLIFLAYLYQKKPPEILKRSDLAVVTVLPDIEYQHKLYAACTTFWFDNVLAKVPPPPAEGDYVMLKGYAELAHRWKKLDIEIKELERCRDEVKDELLKVAAESGHKRLKAGGVRIVQVSKVGNVDYKKIPELEDVDLDQYRKKGSTYWKMEIPKGVT